MEIKLNKDKTLSRSELILIICGFLLFFLFLYLIIDTLTPMLVTATIILMLFPLVKYKVVKILIITVSLLFLIWLANGMMNILQPFIIGIVIAYLLNPLIKILEKKMSRSLAVGLMLLLVLAILGLILFLVVPMLLKSLEKIKLPTTMDELKINFTNAVYPYVKKFGLDRDDLRNLWTSQIAPGIENLLRGLFSGLNNFGGVIVQIFQRILYFLILPFFIYYILVDWNKLLRFVHDLFPLNKQAKFEYYFEKIDKIFNSYIRGLIIIATLNAFDVTILLFLFGFDYPILVGLISGLFTFIPQFGVMISIAVNIVVCFIGVNPGFYVPVTISILLGHNILEAALITPKLVGKKINVHPALLIISVFVFAYLFGFIGLFVAAPVTAILVSIIKEWKAEKREIEKSRNIIT
jgi:predicted PurR-regulated permease PerM